MKKEDRKVAAENGIPKIKGEAAFLRSIRDSIDAGSHVDYVKHALEEYDEYKRFFHGVFIGCDYDVAQTTVFRFRVEYRLKHPVWREFEIVGNESLEEFAEAIIESMDFANDHLHSFFFPEKRGKKTVYAYSSLAINSRYLEDDPYPTYKTNQISVACIDYAKYPKSVLSSTLAIVTNFPWNFRERARSRSQTTSRSSRALLTFVALVLSSIRTMRMRNNEEKKCL